MVCPHRQKGRGLSQCRHFADSGDMGQFFVIFVDIFYRWPFKLHEHLLQVVECKLPLLQLIWPLAGAFSQTRFSEIAYAAWTFAAGW